MKAKDRSSALPERLKELREKRGCTIEQFAANFHERYREKLLQNEELRAFLEAANRRHSGKK